MTYTYAVVHVSMVYTYMYSIAKVWLPWQMSLDFMNFIYLQL